jgi:two-component system sensor histidine kinase BaeS
MRSLALKLTLAFLCVGVVAVALVGVFVGLRVQNAYNRWLADQRVASLAAMLESYYQVNGSWAGVGEVLRQPGMGHGMMDLRNLSVALLDADERVVLAAGEFGPTGGLRPADRRRAIALEVNGRTVGWLVPGRRLAAMMPMMQTPPEALLLQRISRAILFGALAAVGLALVVGAVLARTLTRPLHELTAATHALAEGRLGQQVTVHSDDEIGELAAAFNRMSADLARTSEARKQMTADIAHELRTPLAVLVGYTEALQDGKLAGSPQAYAALHETARHLQRLVDDLGTLALADAGELPLHRRPVEPRALLERAVVAHSVQAQQAGVALVLEASPDLPALNVDPDRISQVLDNLVANALRYTPAGGRIVLSAEHDARGGMVVLRVQDTGAGIAPADLPFVFERFYRGDKARQPSQGTVGLGLAIARSLVESHAGTIEVASTLGQGTTFTIRLPAA